jgi:hypothetical protein
MRGAFLHSSFSREVSPKGQKPWLVEDENQLLESAFASWMTDVAENEKLFQKHVYDNPNPTDLDLRQHRARLFALLTDGEHLALAYFSWGNQHGKMKEVMPYIALLDQKLKAILDAVISWHGGPGAQTDIPESFKQSMREAEQGNIVDLDI